MVRTHIIQYNDIQGSDSPGLWSVVIKSLCLYQFLDLEIPVTLFKTPPSAFNQVRDLIKC
jgi:hypothetical protein